MKKTYFIIIILSILFFYDNYKGKFIQASDVVPEKTVKETKNDVKSYEGTISEVSVPEYHNAYSYPKFYKGIYLTIGSARNITKLKKFIQKAKKSHINTFVMDMHNSRYKKCLVPKENVDLVLAQGIHPIARIVCFPEGLKHYPVTKEMLEKRLNIAEQACKNGFKEIQFDYIRFNDSSRLRYLKRKDRYKFIEGFLANAGTRLKKYNVKIAADVFGRIPLNRGDIIGQRMEGLDKVVDIICPMAYPSHYTWSKKLQYNPYHTVYITSKKANDRTKNAEIVTYIQAFKMKLGKIPYSKYIKDQIRACHDSGIRGFLFWNARQDYQTPLAVTKAYYDKKNSVVREQKKGEQSLAD